MEKEPVQKPEKETTKEKKAEKKHPAQEKVEELERQLKEQKDLLLRTAAEYDNYRKRTTAEKTQIYNDATSAAVNEILPIGDNLERALALQDCSAEDMRKGVEMVQTQFFNTLEKLGVKAMGEKGEPFDPELHNAVMHVEDDSLGENVIAEVFQKGYRIGDKVVRHAMVKVAN